MPWINAIPTINAINSRFAYLLKEARKLTVNLGSETSASFNGSADCDIGVKGILGFKHGGTGAQYNDLNDLKEKWGLNDIGAGTVKSVNGTQPGEDGDVILDVVPSTRKINEHELTSDIKLTADDVGAQSPLGFTPVQQSGGTDQLNNKVYIGWTGSKLKAQVDLTDMGGFVFDSRKINGHALSSDFNLTAGDIGVSVPSFALSGNTLRITY